MKYVIRMAGHGELFFILKLVILYVPLLESQYCDEGRVGDLQEGNFGQSGVFPWLGVLRVHLHEGDTLKIAVTGIVLIKKKFALGNANDIVRIPRDVFKDDSKAMFIPERDQPWTSPVEDYIIHPEYEYSTLNTIAIIELKQGLGDFIPFKPICCPKYSYNTSNHLYVIGYTDENRLLEKEIYKLQFVKQKHCDEFYSRAGLNDNKVQHVQCAYAEHAKSDCVWESGQVMASNATGLWTVIGLGVHGPGCAAPARFIDLFQYLIWIQTATDLEQISDYRKSAFGTGFKTNKQQKIAVKSPEAVEVPIHETFLRRDEQTDATDHVVGTNNDTTLEPSAVLHPYRIKFQDESFFKVDRIDQDAININIFDNKYESTPHACEAVKTLIYNDKTKIVSTSNKPVISGVYRLTVHDMTVMGYSCIKVSVQSLSHERVKLWWRTSMDKYEVGRFEDLGELPRKLIKNQSAWMLQDVSSTRTSRKTRATIYRGPTYWQSAVKPPRRVIPVRPRMPSTTPSHKWIPGEMLEAQHLIDQQEYEGLENINLLIRFNFSGEAVLHVAIYGPPYPPGMEMEGTTLVPESDQTTLPSHESTLRPKTDQTTALRHGAEFRVEFDQNTHSPRRSTIKPRVTVRNETLLSTYWSHGSKLTEMIKNKEESAPGALQTKTPQPLRHFQPLSSEAAHEDPPSSRKQERIAINTSAENPDLYMFENRPTLMEKRNYPTNRIRPLLSNKIQTLSRFDKRLLKATQRRAERRYIERMRENKESNRVILL